MESTGRPRGYVDPNWFVTPLLTDRAGLLFGEGALNSASIYQGSVLTR
jgi:hypothetical protein